MTAAVQRKRSRKQRVRLEDFLALEDSHPYGCLPGGNRFFAITDAGTTGTKETEWLSDSLWQSVLGFCDALTLCQVVQSSRYLYVAGHQPELWRDLVLRRCEEEHRVIDCVVFNDCGTKVKSWRDMYLCLFAKKSKYRRSHTPLAIPGIYSDEYYRTHRCRSFAIPDAWLDPNVTAMEDSLPSVSIDDITPESFMKDFEANNKPVIIKSAAKFTRALHQWKDPTYLQRHNSKGKSFRTTSGAAPLPAQFTLEAYQAYSEFEYLEESPLYLFDRTALDNPQWHDDYFPEFYEKCPWWDPSAQYGHDLFQHLGAAERPDHTWLIMGPKRSGSVFHIDPNATHAWNACIQGRKRWIFYPPGCAPPGVFPSDDGDEVIVPLSVGEWLLQYWPEHLERCKVANNNNNNNDQQQQPLECTLYPGDVIFVPHGWWHMVINLDDTNCAITHNYVSPSNLGNVLKFLVDKQDQISGCRDRTESIKPEHLYDALVQVLSKVEPKVLQRAQEQKGWTCQAWKDEKDKEKQKQKQESILVSDQSKWIKEQSMTSVMSKMDKSSAFSFSFL